MCQLNTLKSLGKHLKSVFLLLTKRNCEWKIILIHRTVVSFVHEELPAAIFPGGACFGSRATCLFSTAIWCNIAVKIILVDGKHAIWEPTIQIVVGFDSHNIFYTFGELFNCSSGQQTLRLDIQYIVPKASNVCLLF